MNRFYKNSFVIAIVSIVIGLSFSIVGAVGGGIGLFCEMVESGEFEFDWGEDIFGIRLFGGDEKRDGDTAGNPQGIYSLSEYVINNIQLDIGKVNCEIVYEQGADAYNILMEEGDSQQVKYGVKNHTLYVKCSNGRSLFAGKTAGPGKIVITIPEKKVYDSLELTLGAGNLEMENELAAKNVSMEVGAGNIKADKITTQEKFQCEVGAGDIEISEFSAKTLDAQCAMGEISIDSATVSGDIKIECNLGQVKVALEEEQETFNYDISCAMGTISVGEEERSGMESSQSIDNKADRTCTVECNMGSVIVDFQ